MKELFCVRGEVNEDFIGQINYIVCLEKEYKSLDICFSFDKEKQRYCEEEINTEVINKFREACGSEYNVEKYSDNELKEIIKGNCKTEIHISAHLNGKFIGCVHKQLTERHMIFNGDEVSDGCIKVNEFKGTLKITLLVFNVIKANTGYKLKVSAC